MKMIKRIWKKIRGYTPLSLLVFVMIMLATPVFAAYNYVIPIQVTNNSTTSYTNLPILVPIYNDQLVTEGFIDATGLDTDVQEGASSPFSVVDDKLGIFTTGITGSQSLSFTDYLGYTPNAASYPLITGLGGYVTTSDDATLELGDNFTVDLSGFIDTDDVDGNIIYKTNSFAITVSDTEEITAGAIDAETWSVGVENTYSTGPITDQIVLQLDTDRFVVIYELTNAVYARVGTVNVDDSITWGAESGALGKYFYVNDEIGACLVDDDTFVIAYGDGADRDGYTSVATVNPATNAVTWADTDEFANLNTQDISCCKVDTDKWAIVYEDTTGTDTETVVCTWSGAATTVGAPVVLDVDAALAVTGCCQLDTNKYVAIFESADIEARACTVAGTIPTPGVLKTISTDNATITSAIQLDTDIFLAYWDDAGATGIIAEICTVSTTTITDSTQYTLTITDPYENVFTCIKVSDGELLLFIQNWIGRRRRILFC